MWLFIFCIEGYYSFLKVLYIAHDTEDFGIFDGWNAEPALRYKCGENSGPN